MAQFEASLELDPHSRRRRNPIVFLDIAIGRRPAGRIVIELRADVVPVAAENFRCLCTGEKGNADGTDLCYRGTVIHRVVRDYLIQGGDIERGDGTGRLSAFGGVFDDENFVLQHTGPGVLSCCNAGPDTNSSQFFITTVETPWLDDKHVVFGYCVGADSMHTVSRIEANGSESGRTKSKVVISDCGQLFP